MKRFSPLVIALALLLVAALSNPGAQHHRERISASVSERSELNRLLGIGKLTSFVSVYHSLGIASYSTVDEEVVAIGAFGMVFVIK